MKRQRKALIIGIVAMVASIFGALGVFGQIDTYATTEKVAKTSSSNVLNFMAEDVEGFNQVGDCSRTFLGMISWDCGTNFNSAEGTDTIVKNVWVIGSNIATDISIAASYLVLGFVIYGGYLYICSNGDPNKVAMGKKTLIQAFIGLAIAMLAHVILAAIRTALSVNLSQDCITQSCIGENPAVVVSSAIQWVIGVAGVVALIFVVCGGIAYITAAGDTQKVEKAKKIILYALIGLIIVGLAEVITAFMSKTIREAEQGAMLIETIKEPNEIDEIS